MLNQKNTQRDNRDDYDSNRGSQGSNNKIKTAVEEIFKKRQADYTVLNDLRRKYKDDDLVDAIYDQYRKRLRFIIKKAQKIDAFVNAKYGTLTLSDEDRIRKIKKIIKKKKDWEITDAEFQFIVNNLMTGKYNHQMAYVKYPNSQLARTLGFSNMGDAYSDRLNVKPEELEVVQDILRLYGQTKSLHAQILLQTLGYRDVAPEAITGGGYYKPDRDNHYNFVHPVVAALFLPKFKLIEELMLIANIGYIIKSKNDGVPLMTQPDYELYWAMISDPSSKVCHRDSPIKDVYARFLLQTKIWDHVLNLRQGKYYNATQDFIPTIENCNTHLFDAPDMTYVKDEGTILRRILGAFSIRPTLVATNRLYGVLSSYATNDPLAAAGISDVTTVPIVNLRLSMNIINNNTPTHLNDSLSQPQWYVENHMVVPKSQSIMHSRDILIFYVNRRFQSLNIAQIRAPCNFNMMPMTIAGSEALNNRVVNFDKRIVIMGEEYLLRSVVLIEVSKARKNLIVGSSAAIVIPRNINEGVYDESYLLYDPQGAGEMFKLQGDGYVRNAPVTYIPGDTTLNDNGNVESFYSRASQRGTIYIYQKTTYVECVNQTY